VHPVHPKEVFSPGDDLSVFAEGVEEGFVEGDGGDFGGLGGEVLGEVLEGFERVGGGGY
jgi:hypothetical protein